MATSRYSHGEGEAIALAYHSTVVGQQSQVSFYLSISDHFPACPGNNFVTVTTLAHLQGSYGDVDVDLLGTLKA